jgi:hypothetical protein
MEKSAVSSKVGTTTPVAAMPRFLTVKVATFDDVPTGTWPKSRLAGERLNTDPVAALPVKAAPTLFDAPADAVRRPLLNAMEVGANLAESVHVAPAARTTLQPATMKLALSTVPITGTVVAAIPPLLTVKVTTPEIPPTDTDPKSWVAGEMVSAPS